MSALQLLDDQTMQRVRRAAAPRRTGRVHRLLGIQVDVAGLDVAIVGEASASAVQREYGSSGS